MLVLQVEARISPEQLLQAVDQMSPDELAAFARRVVELRARRVAPFLSNDESPLLERINGALPLAHRARYAALAAQRSEAPLSEAEHVELIALSDELEAIDADRIAAIAELAQLRGLSLGQMMAALGVR